MSLCSHWRLPWSSTWWNIVQHLDFCEILLGIFSVFEEAPWESCGMLAALCLHHYKWISAKVRRGHFWLTLMSLVHTERLPWSSTWWNIVQHLDFCEILLGIFSVFQEAPWESIIWCHYPGGCRLWAPTPTASDSELSWRCCMMAVLRHCIIHSGYLHKKVIPCWRSCPCVHTEDCLGLPHGGTLSSIWYLHTFQASRITDSMAEGNRQANGRG